MFGRTCVGSVLMACLVALSLGCQQRNPDESAALTDQEAEHLLVVVIDLSGSYAQFMTEDGRAYQFLMRLIGRFFHDRIGSNDRIVISQISSPHLKQTLLWEGSPRAFAGEFQTAAGFRTFLLAHSDPNGSRVHDTIADAIEYVLDYPGVAEKRTKTAVIALTDMLDNAAEPEKSRQRLQDALGKYGRCGGIVGLYWVEQTLVSPWRQRLREARLKEMKVESEIVVQPDLPRFDD